MNKAHSLIHLIATPEMIGQRADKAIGLLPEVGSRSRAEYLLNNSYVTINGVPPKNSQKIKDGDKIEIHLPPKEEGTLSPLDLALDILFEDKDLIVINKPSGLVIHPAAGHENDTLVNALLHHTSDLSMKFGENRPGIVHRLDKETSGVLVVAKNDIAHESLTQQFKARSVHRIYFAATLGTPKVEAGKVQSFLARHPVDRKKYASVRDSQKKIIHSKTLPPSIGKWAVTNYRVVERLPSGLGLLQLKLETGRTHQIRIHLSEIGCPILGDTLYGADKKVKVLSSPALREKILGLARFALHASELGFIHPNTNKELLFKVPWPDDIRLQLIQLGYKEVK